MRALTSSAAMSVLLLLLAVVTSDEDGDLPPLPPIPESPTLPPLPPIPERTTFPALPPLPPIPERPTLPPLPPLPPIPERPTLPPLPPLPPIPERPTLPTLPPDFFNPNPTEGPTFPPFSIGVYYEDQCDIRGGEYYKCGDSCLAAKYKCDCGGTTLSFETSPTRHCCPVAPCSQRSSWSQTSGIYYWGDVTCDGGVVLDIKTPCHGQCYADISNSLYLDYYQSRYLCEGRKDECLTVSSRCQGWCSSEICRNQTLRCGYNQWLQPVDQFEENGITISPASLKRSEIIEEHSYCKVDNLRDNNIYDVIDRSDEVIPKKTYLLS